MAEQDGEAARNLDRVVTRLATESEYLATNRRGLLMIHAVGTVLTGALLCLDGAPSPAYLIPVERPLAGIVLGVPAVFGGSLLLSSVLWHRRGPELLGLVVVAAWFVVMAALFLLSAISTQAGPLISYPVTVYGQLAGLLAWHVVAAWKLLGRHRGG